MNPDESAISEVLKRSSRPDAARVVEILSRASELHGLPAQDVAALTHVTDPELRGRIFETARRVKETIYGPRLVLFAPLYVSNLCGNDCAYCAFRVGNMEIKRRALTKDEIRREAEALLVQGHKRVLLVAGESYPKEGFRYVMDAVHTLYDARVGEHRINRINANVAPLTVEAFRALKTTGIGTYQVFQETYHHQTYVSVHLSGRKRDVQQAGSGPPRPGVGA